MEMALSFLSRIDPEAFEIALNAATPADGDLHEDDEDAIPADGGFTLERVSTGSGIFSIIDATLDPRP